MARRNRAEVDPRVTRHEKYEDARLSLQAGDSILVVFPRTTQKQSATFRAYVVPDRGVPYLDVADKQGLSRCVRAEDVYPSRSKKKRRGRK